MRDVQDATGTTPTAAASTGRYPGSALCRERILPGDEPANNAKASGAEGANALRMACMTSESGIRPHATTSLGAARLWFRCRRLEGDPVVCSEPRHPHWWDAGHGRLDNSDIFCSRFNQGVPANASSGSRRFMEVA
ncbi:unnamed protein product [Sphacelaria rigidula]